MNVYKIKLYECYEIEEIGFPANKTQKDFYIDFYYSECERKNKERTKPGNVTSHETRILLLINGLQ